MPKTAYSSTFVKEFYISTLTLRRRMHPLMYMKWEVTVRLTDEHYLPKCKDVSLPDILEDGSFNQMKSNTQDQLKL